MRSALLLAFALLSGCGRRSSPPEPIARGGGPADAAPPAAPCRLPSTVTEDLTLKSGCVVTVATNVLVANGRTLTIEPGVTLRFHATSYLEIGHKGSRLVARGTDEKPIVFTSAEKSPGRGDWVGLVIDDAPGEGTAIEHAVIEYAGRESHGGQGALTAYRAFPAGRVALREVTFRHNETAISNPHPRATFAAFERNVFTDNARALRAPVSVLGVLGVGNDIADPIDVLGGTIADDATLRETRAGYHVTAPIYVNGVERTASLTLAKGVVLRFAPNTWLEVGTTGPAALHASGATLTSAADKPSAGDWVGIFFGDKTRPSSITGSVIEYAGAEEHGSDAAVTFVGSKSWQALDVHFAGVRFRKVRQAHFSSNGEGCNKALDPRNGMSWDGATEPCR